MCAFGEGFSDQPSFVGFEYLHERPTVAWQIRIGPRGCGRKDRKIDLVGRGQEHGAFDDILKFPDVAGPCVGLEVRPVGLGEFQVRPAIFSRDIFENPRRQRENVRRPVPKGRNVQPADVEAIVQVIPEPSGGNFLVDFPVCGRNDPARLPGSGRPAAIENIND